MVLITIVTGAYKPTYNWGGPHCRYIVIYHVLVIYHHSPVIYRYIYGAYMLHDAICPCQPG